ncbi:hypothetical protein CHS0354_036374 [Potamilus streckersoni]|uniref:Uncharacterized protein n=1 Tax=Potamilus streckersoni TaxID=2493646 RepID=A0AAE0SS45_9BIVA|nr:hypothetical protein CHS0354_036374 [Potamilus streckersoni]
MGRSSMFTFYKNAAQLKSLIILPVAFLFPLPVLILETDLPDQAARCAYVILAMAILWLTEAIPIAATALLPVFLLPMLKVMTASATCSSYITDSSMLFLGGLILAAAVEEWNLHKRIALLILKLIGSQPNLLMLGLMFTTWILSMWISNTATASMMLPIIYAVVNQLQEVHREPEQIDQQEGVTNPSFELKTTEEGAANCNATSPNQVGDIYEQVAKCNEASIRKTHTSKIAKGFSLCVAYAANIGGIATLTGTPPNLVLKDNVDKLYTANKENPPISFANWMAFAVPLSLMTLLLAWAILQIMFLSCTCCRKVDSSRKMAIRDAMQRHYNSLGRISFAEVIVGVLFILLVILWLSREPPESDGWGVLFRDKMGKIYVSDSTAAILVISLLFFLPAKRPNIFCWRNSLAGPKYTPLLTWQTVNKKVPWGIMVLLGGGFAIADASRKSKLSDWVGDQLAVFNDHELWIMNLIFCCIVTMATEVTSNTATANLLMPIMIELSKSTSSHPVYLMSSVAIACSFAFMLPAATPPNAIVFSSGYLSIPDMALTGLLMNIVAVLSLTVGINTWGKVIYDFDTIPSFMANFTRS